MSKAKVYGNALYELGSEDGVAGKIAEEFEGVTNLLERNVSFIKLLSNPRISTQERLEIVDGTFSSKIQPYLLSLLKILTEEREISLFSQIFKEYQKKYYKENNILLITAISAVSLDEEQKQKLIKKMERQTGKTIILKNRIDASCIGGIRIEYDGHLIDASIQNRFKNLEHILKNADYSQAEV